MKFSLKFNFNQLEKGPINLTGKTDASSFDIFSDEIITFHQIHYSICISPINGGALVNADLSVDTVRRCVRCLKEFQSNLDLPGLTHFYEKTECQEFDLIPDFRDDILLSLPLNMLCKHNCKGLCPICGIDLNISQCHCSDEEESEIKINSEWEKLDELIFEPKNKNIKKGKKHGSTKKKKI